MLQLCIEKYTENGHESKRDFSKQPNKQTHIIKLSFSAYM